MLVLSLLLIGLIVHHRSETQTNPRTCMMSRPKILLLGDSLTQLGFGEGGWASRIADAYQRRADVVNRGMAGYNTRWFLSYAEKSDVWKQENVELVVLFFGANDASDEELNPRHHIPIPEFKENLGLMISKAKAAYGKDVAIVLMCTSPVVHAQRIQFQIKRYGDKATGELERNMVLSQKYADAAKDVAVQTGTPYVHHWNLMQQQEEEDWESFFYDGLHFTPKGNKFVATALLREIAKSYPKLQVRPCPHTGHWGNSGSQCEALLRDGPFHDEIDYKDHVKAFE